MKQRLSYEEWKGLVETHMAVDMLNAGVSAADLRAAIEMRQAIVKAIEAVNPPLVLGLDQEVGRRAFRVVGGRDTE